MEIISLIFVVKDALVKTVLKTLRFVFLMGVGTRRRQAPELATNEDVTVSG
jgi:hypothetical protein